MINLKLLKEISNDQKLRYLIMDAAAGLFVTMILYNYQINHLEEREEDQNG